MSTIMKSIILAVVILAVVVHIHAQPESEALTTDNVPYVNWNKAVSKYGLERAVHLLAPEMPGASQRCSMPSSKPDIFSPNKCFRIRKTDEGYCCWLSRKGEIEGVNVMPDFKGLLPLECCSEKEDVRAFDDAECRMILPKLCELLQESGQGQDEDDDVESELREL